MPVAEMLPIEDAPETFSKLYVFGDSLSDPGNQLQITTFVQPLEPTLGIDFPIDPPTPPYFQGRYSNGPIWVEYVASSLDITVTPSSQLSVLYPRRPLPSPITVTDNGAIVSPFFNGTLSENSVNFAFGGSQTGTAGSGEFGEFIPGVLKQVNWFRRDLARSGVRAESEALYILWAGPNDYQSVSTPVPLQSAQESVGNIERALAALYNLGARNFLVPNLPDLGKTARALSRGTEESTRLTTLTILHNFLLSDTLGVRSQSLPDVNIIPLDVYSLLQETLSLPEQFGFTNVTEPCLDTETLIPCSNPNEYLFWDGIHITGISHQILGEFAVDAIGL